MLSRIIVATAALVVVLLSVSHAAPAPSRAVSLNAASAAMRSGKMAAQAQTLCGITRLSGYVIDSNTRDIVLVGKVDPSLPPLRLDDLAVSLRNAWLVYSQVRGRTRYYSDPGCSIDPDPRVLGQLRELQSTPLDFSNPDDVRSQTDAWDEIGKQPQRVRVMGVPFDSNFAKVMVDADYYMKRLVNGSVALNIDGFESLSDLHVKMERSRSSENSDAPTRSMNRFWFSPGDTTYEESDGLVVLKSCTVKLLTEEEFLNEHGTVSGTGRPDPLANQFAQSFTRKYDQIASQRPIYKQLQALFAFAALARLMKDGRADDVAPSAINYLLRVHKVAVTPVSRAVNGLTSIRRIDEVVDTPQGRRNRAMILSSCGGVSMSVRPKRVGSTKATATPTSARGTAVAGKGKPGWSKAPRPAKGSSLKHVVMSSKKSPNALTWDIPAQFD